MPRLFVPLMVLLHSLSGEPSGVYFADSTKLAVCHNRRIHRHRGFNKIMLRKRFLIETVLDTLKSERGLEHSRHSSVINAMVHVLSGLVADAFRPGKPSISLTSQRLEAYP
jgi:Transposase DDE domain